MKKKVRALRYSIFCLLGHVLRRLRNLKPQLVTELIVLHWAYHLYEVRIPVWIQVEADLFSFSNNMSKRTINFEINDKYFFLMRFFVTSRAKGEGNLDFWMWGRRLDGYIRLLGSDYLCIFVGTFSLVRYIGPELFTMIIKDWIYI